MSDRMKKLIEELAEHCNILGSFRKEDVIELERQLGVPLPNSYKKFLGEFGSLDVFGYEFLGLVHGEPRTVPSVLFRTRDLRNAASLPFHFIPVLVDDDYVSALDTSSIMEGECPVVEIWASGEMDREEVNKVANTFEEFFVELVSEQRKRRGL